MKKKIILTGITVTAFLILAIYLFNRPQLLGNMKSSCTEQTTTTSDITFSGKAGDKIKFSFRSNIENGDLNMILYDSNNHAVYTLDQAKNASSLWMPQTLIRWQRNVITLSGNIILRYIK